MNADFDKYQESVWATLTNVRAYDHPVVQAFARQRVREIEPMLGSWKPGNALDVGCGDGFGMYSMRSIVNVIHGCDRSRKMLNANPASAACLKECDAYHLPYESSAFDLVYCWELLHHVAEPEKVVREMTRVASKCVLLCEPNCLNPAMALFGLLHPLEHGLLRFTPSYPGRLLRDAGLKNIRSVTVGWFTPMRTPGWLARFMSKLPYRVPMLGLYTITLGFKDSNGSAGQGV
jgi:ubiquinone/menaquinone biosynthesis C-methylase UbiE